MREPILSAAEVAAYINEVFPQQRDVYQVLEVGPMRSKIRQSIAYAHLRPGDTVSGPTIFAIADCAFYMACLAMEGRKAMMVTSNLTLNFLRRPPAADLTAEARILKLGRTLITGEVYIHSDGVDGPVAHATTTYAVPA
ncbi:MAG: PaaI family thioesterase [Pseudomonadota bacterium]